MSYYSGPPGQGKRRIVGYRNIGLAPPPGSGGPIIYEGDWDDPTKDTVGLPASVERYSGYSRGEAECIRTEQVLSAVNTLCRTDAERGALMVSAAHGREGIVIETLEEVNRGRLVPKKFLGITYGDRFVSEPTTRRVRRVIKFL